MTPETAESEQSRLETPPRACDEPHRATQFPTTTKWNAGQDFRRQIDVDISGITSLGQGHVQNILRGHPWTPCFAQWKANDYIGLLKTCQCSAACFHCMVAKMENFGHCPTCLHTGYITDLFAEIVV